MRALSSIFSVSMFEIKELRKSKRKIILTGIFTVGIFFAVCFASFHKNSGQEAIASGPDSVIKLQGHQNELIQSWQANSRNINGFVLATEIEQNEELTGRLRLRVKEQIEGENFLCEGETELSQISDNGEYTFLLPKTNLELGKRYYLQIELLDAPKETSVAVCMNSDYGGLLAAGEEQEGAMIGTVLYQFSGNLVWLARIFLLFSGITFFLMILFKRRYEEVFALTFGVIFVYLYIFGIFEQLEFGVQSLYILAMIMAVGTPFLALYKGRKISDMINPGMIAFWFLFLIYFVLDRNMVAGKADDLNHWQLAVRDMWYFDSYPFHPGSTLIAMRYTPGFATIEYLFLYLYGTYREGIVLLGCHTIGFAMLSVLYTKINWKQCHKVIPLTVLIAGFPLLIYQSHYGIMYVDAYLGMIGAYILICYFTEEHSLFNVFRITFGSILLIMTKEMGLAIAGIIYFIIFIDIFIKNPKIKQFIKSKHAKEYFLSGCLALGSFITWQLYIVIVGGKYGLNGNSTNILKMFGISKANVENMDNILLASAVDTHALQRAAEQVLDTPNIVSSATPGETIIEMIKWFFTEKTFIGGSYFELTLIVVLLCSILGIAGFYRKQEIPMKQIIISLLIGTVLYTAFLVICYIFLFREASAIPAARRYMGSYLLMFLITIPGIMIVKQNIIEEKKNWKQPVVWIIALFILLCVPDGHPYYIAETNHDGWFITWQNHQSIGEVFRSFADKDEKVYYVEYSNSELIPQYNYLTFANSVVPNLTQGLGGGWKPVTSAESPYFNYTVQYTTEEWGQLLAEQYTYVYLRYVDDYFEENYAELFLSKEDISNGAFYKVETDGNEQVLLRKIAYKNLN